MRQFLKIHMDPHREIESEPWSRPALKSSCRGAFGLSEGRSEEIFVPYSRRRNVSKIAAGPHSGGAGLLFSAAYDMVEKRKPNTKKEPSIRRAFGIAPRGVV